MMQISGLIEKMNTSLDMGIAQYRLPIGEKMLNMNDLIGERISLNFDGKIYCSNCGKKTNKSYSQGYCFPCCQKLARCDMCIMKPEQCHHHMGTCREPEWGTRNCFTPHVVYLANSSGVKVGITRKSNTPSRWIDQGAVAALPILEVDTRLKSGQIEVALKEYVNDKTNWRKMLKNEVTSLDLVKISEELIPKISSAIKQTNATIIYDRPLEINYPVIQYPNSIDSLNLDKSPLISGMLLGIKAQYLIFDCGVLNIRKFSSYNIAINY
jgi:hypothetical protein